MNVIIDIEWIQNNGTSSITQLAAVRVSDDWNTVNVFQRLVCPDIWHNTDWEHMAYSGYSPDEFRAGVDEKTCISDFVHFLTGGDIILCWHKATERLLNQKVSLYIKKPLPVECECVNNEIYSMVKARKIVAHTLYEAAEGLGIAVPAPQHQSINDVQVMQSLLSELEYSVRPFPTLSAEEIRVKRRKRNADMLSYTQYNYVFSPNSGVFHRTGCHLILNSRDIHGCINYRTAAKARVPCKVCRPEPVEQNKQAKAADAQENTDSPWPAEKKVISAKLLGGRIIPVTNSKLVGACHNRLHPGKLTKKIMEEHDCIGKNCVFFERYEDSSYWIAEKNRKLQKEDRKRMRQVKKQAEHELEKLRELFQSYADEAGYEMIIVRLEKVHSARYRVFYVSNNPFADGNRFPELLASIKYCLPMHSVQLAHIKAVDGHFVTISEFLSRKK